jgi:hypothetical protein
MSVSQGTNYSNIESRATRYNHHQHHPSRPQMPLLQYTVEKTLDQHYAALPRICPISIIIIKCNKFVQVDLNTPFTNSSTLEQHNEYFVRSNSNNIQVGMHLFDVMESCNENVHYQKHLQVYQGTVTWLHHLQIRMYLSYPIGFSWGACSNPVQPEIPSTSFPNAPSRPRNIQFGKHPVNVMQPYHAKVQYR